MKILLLKIESRIEKKESLTETKKTQNIPIEQKSDKKNIIPLINESTKLASPKIRKFARELGANVIQIPGTQRSGRVSEEDVKNFIKSQVFN